MLICPAELTTYACTVPVYLQATPGFHWICHMAMSGCCAKVRRLAARLFVSILCLEEFLQCLGFCSKCTSLQSWFSATHSVRVNMFLDNQSHRLVGNQSDADLALCTGENGTIHQPPNEQSICCCLIAALATVSSVRIELVHGTDCLALGSVVPAGVCTTGTGSGSQWRKRFQEWVLLAVSAGMALFAC